MKLTTIMDKIQEADIVMTTIEPLEEYAFGIDLSAAIEKSGKYNKLYYIRCEALGLTYKEAQTQLSEHIMDNYGYERKDKDD